MYIIEYNNILWWPHDSLIPQICGSRPPILRIDDYDRSDRKANRVHGFKCQGNKDIDSGPLTISRCVLDAFGAEKLASNCQYRVVLAPNIDVQWPFTSLPSRQCL